MYQRSSLQGNSLPRRISRNLARAANAFGAKVAILMYHRISHVVEDPWNLAVAPERFGAQLRHLNQHYDVLRLRDIPEMLRSRTLPRRAVVLTFDDGYRDNLINALPVLENAHVPATFFIATGSTTSRREFWWDELARLVLSAPDLSAPIAMPPVGHPHASRAWLTSSPEERHSTHLALHNRLLRVGFEDRELVLSAVRSWAAHDRGPSPDALPMTIQELAALAASTVADLGAHSVGHLPMDGMEFTAQSHEIIESRRQLQSWIEKPVVSFSYPYGYYNRESVRALEDCGFELAVTCRDMAVQHGDHPLELGRFSVANWDDTDFAQQLARFFWRQSARHD